jgi:hypothetical protein
MTRTRTTQTMATQTPTTGRAVTTAVAAAALGGLLVVAAAAVTAVLVGALLLAQAAVLAGWHRGLRVPGLRGGVVVGTGAAVAADLLVTAAPDDRPLRALPAVMAGVLVASLVHQVLRRGGRVDLVASLTATGTLGALVALAAMHLGTAAEPDGTVLVATAAVPAALVAVAEALRPATGAPTWSGLVVAVVAALVTAAAAVSAADRLGWSVALGAAAAGAAAGWVGTVAAARTARLEPALVIGLPQVLAAPAVYVASRLLAG